jgi:hypothetical protein
MIQEFFIRMVTTCGPYGERVAGDRRAEPVPVEIDVRDEGIPGVRRPPGDPGHVPRGTAIDRKSADRSSPAPGVPGQDDRAGRIAGAGMSALRLVAASVTDG